MMEIYKTLMTVALVDLFVCVISGIIAWITDSCDGDPAFEWHMWSVMVMFFVVAISLLTLFGTGIINLINEIWA